MTATMVLWFAGGLATGLAHAWLIWRASQPPFRWASAGLLRMMPVAAVLVAAAMMGGLIPVAAGWLTAFLISVGAVAMRKPT